jgi:hypothetical protein
LNAGTVLHHYKTRFIIDSFIYTIWFKEDFFQSTTHKKPVVCKIERTELATLTKGNFCK